MFLIVKVKDDKLKLAHPTQIDDAKIALDIARELALKSDNVVYYVCELVHKVYASIQIDNMGKIVEKHE